MKYYIKLNGTKIVDAINYTLKDGQINLEGEGEIVEGFIECESFPPTVLNGNWEYDIVNKAFSENKIVQSKISKDEFSERINDDEWAKIAEHDKVIESLNIPEEEKARIRTTIKAWLMKMGMKTEVDLKDEKTINMTKILVDCGLLSEERAIEILAS